MSKIRKPMVLVVMALMMVVALPSALAQDFTFGGLNAALEATNIGVEQGVAGAEIGVNQGVQGALIGVETGISFI